MRSRYTAFVRRDGAYLLATWHPRTRPLTVDVDDVEWRGLDVIGFSGGGITDSVGTVTFAAHYATGVISTGTMRVTSHFERVEGAWRYVEDLEE